MAATIYTYEENYRAFKALIAAKYSGFEVKVAPNFVFGETNRTDAFLKKFPLGKVPALETADNILLTESNAIAHYVGNTQLRGKSLLEQTQILQWINFADSEVVPSASNWLFPVMGFMQYNKQNTDKAKELIKRDLQILDNHLQTRTYLVGERITQADITLCCVFYGLYTQVFEPSFRKPFPNVNRWFVTLINQPEFKAVMGEVKLCQKMAQFDPAKFAEYQKKVQQKEGIKKGKDEKPKQEKKPKEEKKKQEKVKEPEEEMDETELILAADAKASCKDPFEKFPKGSFNMDEFKRVYSNEDESVSLKYFWEKFDKENYSIWFCEYLFPQELSLVFMSCNLISGMFQRLDKMRKNAFASVILFGEDHKSTISGIWIWRGHDLAFELSEDWQIDYESYSWKKLVASAPETKKLVTEYFSWSGDFGGKKFNQGKIFK